MLVLSFFAEFLTTLLTILLTPRKDLDVPATNRRGLKGQERIFTFVEAINYLLNANETDDVIAKAASKIESFEKFPNQTAAQIAKFLKDKAL